MTPYLAIAAAALLGAPQWTDETGSVTCRIEEGFSPAPKLPGTFVRAGERLLPLPFVPAGRAASASALAELALKRIGASSIAPSSPGVATGVLAAEGLYASAAVVASPHGHGGVLLLSASGGPELAARAARAATECRVLAPLATETRIRDATRALSFPVPAGAKPAVREGNGALVGANWEIRLGAVAPSTSSALAQAQRLLSAAGAKPTSKTSTRAGGRIVALVQGNAGATWVQVAVIDLGGRFGAATLRADPDGVIAGQQAFLALLDAAEVEQ